MPSWLDQSIFDSPDFLLPRDKSKVLSSLVSSSSFFPTRFGAATLPPSVPLLLEIGGRFYLESFPRSVFVGKADFYGALSAELSRLRRLEQPPLAFSSPVAIF